MLLLSSCGPLLTPVAACATAAVSLELGAGAIFQRLDANRGGWSGAAGVAGWAGLQVPLSGPLSLAAEAQLPLVGYRRSSGLAVALVPGAWLGVSGAR